MPGNVGRPASFVTGNVPGYDPVRRRLTDSGVAFADLGGGGGGGSVSSVFGLTGSVMATVAANRVVAGPTSGGSAAPTARALVAGDIPSLPLAKISDAGPLTPISTLTMAADKFIYFSGSSTAVAGTITSAGRALLDDADASAQRTTLGLAIGTDVQAYSATLATLASATAAGLALMDDADASAQRTTLGLAIGTNVQAYSSTLATLASATAAGLALMDDADASAQRTTLGLAIGTNVQAYSSTLATLASSTAAGLALMDDADASAQRTTLGLGSLATQGASSVSVTGGTITGVKVVTGVLTLSSSSGNVAANWGNGANVGDLTLTENSTLSNPTGATDAQKFMYRIKQHASSAKTLSFDTKFRFSTTTPSPTIPATLGKWNRYVFEYHAADDKYDFLSYNEGH